MDQLTQAVTGGGLIMLLGLVVLYLLNSNRLDRAQHQTVITALDTKITRIEEQAAAKIEKLEIKIENLEKEVDTERGMRQSAEFEARKALHELSLHRPGDRP